MTVVGVHHWAQGPMDVTPTATAQIVHGYPRRWVFRYWIEDPLAVVPLTAAAVADKVDWVLNGDPRSWGVRLGINFQQVDRIGDCNIVLRFSNGPPPDWPKLWGSGWYYHDWRVGKNVAHVTAVVHIFNHTALFNHILNMELVGHGTLRMWDMDIMEHVPYVGSMGAWVGSMLNDGWPTDTEIEDGLLWLSGRAFVDKHPEFTVPES